MNSIKIKYGKEVLEIFVSDYESVGDLKEKLSQQINLTHFKLISSGRLLKDDTLIAKSFSGNNNPSITLIASDGSDIKQNLYNPSNRRIIDDLSSNINPVQNPLKINSKRVINFQSSFQFGKVKALDGLPDQAKAQSILESLASDVGILAVMNKHKWSVGALCELYPEGQVGVSDVCVMGLNENHGQRILLRIRTDDLQGFRKILSVKKVLYHELAHNVHSEHDDNFYILMRQIEREASELDWRNSTAHTLSKSRIEYNQSNDSSNYSTNSTTTTTVYRLGGGGSENSVPTVVGGNGVENSSSHFPSLHQFIPARYLAGTAAIMRLTAEEREVEHGCGCKKNRRSTDRYDDFNSNNDNIGIMVSDSTNGENGSNRMIVTDDESVVDENIVRLEEEEETSASMSLKDNELTATKNSMLSEDADASIDADTTTIVTTANEILSVVDESIPTIITTANEMLSVVDESIPTIITTANEMLSVVDESIALTLSIESTATTTTATMERLVALREALNILLTQIFSSVAPTTTATMQLLECMRFLMRIISNAKDNTDLKYRSIKKSSAIYQRLVANHAGAVQILFAAGFSDDTSTNDSSSSSSSSSNKDVLVLRRYDPGLLYTIHSLLHATIEKVDVK